MSQDPLARKLGYDRTVIAKAETGDRPPSRDTEGANGHVLSFPAAAWRQFVTATRS